MKISTELNILLISCQSRLILAWTMYINSSISRTTNFTPTVTSSLSRYYHQLKSKPLYFIPNDSEKHHEDARDSEFASLEPQKETSIRRQRLDDESKDKQRFSPFGQELWTLRNKLLSMSNDLLNAVSAQNKNEINSLISKIKELEKKDPLVVYGLELDAMKASLEEGNQDAFLDHQNKASRARKFLPQLNLNGLWIGRFGDEGFKMINITYTGDILMAKVVDEQDNVSDQNNDDGAFFRLDLSPPRDRDSLKDTLNKSLPNIVLSNEAALRWGMKELPRFPGLGKISESNLDDKNKWVKGEMIMLNEEYISLNWLPSKKQVFFGRPSPDVVIKLLSEISAKKEDDECYLMKEHASKCLDLTDDIVEDEILEGKVDPSGGCIFYIQGSDECFFQ